MSAESDTPAPARLPIVGVMGSSTEAHEPLAQPLGRYLASLDVHLLNGGGGGVMTAVSRAFASVRGRRGLVIGILPGEALGMRHLVGPGYPNPFIDIPVYTHLPLGGIEGTDPRSRNHINILSSDVIVSLPGNDGTRSEVELAIRYQKPVIAFFGDVRVEWPLPPGVPLARTLADVQVFVDRHLHARPRRV
ncbi:MAG: molybdenum cofactor carrier protein [Acidobacteriota bacterium]